MLASRSYNGSRSRKTKGSLADTLQCNIWRRAQNTHRMTHCLHGCNNHGRDNGFTALGKKIGTSKSTETDADYVAEHRPLKYLRKQIAHYLHDCRRHWFPARDWKHISSSADLITFYVSISHCSLFHILTLNPVGIPTVSKLECQRRKSTKPWGAFGSSPPA